MAANSGNSLRLNLTHGPKKYEINLELAPGDPGEELTVAHLAKEAATLTEVPRGSQKLIFKGKSLVDQFQSLKSLGLKNGSKLMLIGKKSSLQDDQNMVTMAMIEADLAKVEKKLSDITSELDGIQGGFLAADLQEEALKRLRNQLGCCTEEFTRLLLRLDALSLGEAATEVRNRRKNLVSKIQAQLDRCDTVRNGLSDMRDQTKTT